MSDSEIDATRRAWSAEVTALQKMLADAEALLAEAEAACAALRTWINAQASVCPCGGALGGHAPQCGARMVLSSDAGARILDNGLDVRLGLHGVDRGDRS